MNNIIEIIKKHIITISVTAGIALISSSFGMYTVYKHRLPKPIVAPISKDSEAKKPEAKKPEAKNSEAKNSEAENSEAEKPKAKNSEAKNSEAEKPKAKNSEAKKPEDEKPEDEILEAVYKRIHYTNGWLRRKVVHNPKFRLMVMKKYNITGEVYDQLVAEGEKKDEERRVTLTPRKGK